MRNKLILTAGPWVTDKEVEYVADAARNGWNEKCYDYLYKFQDEFAKYTKSKYAIAVTGGTHALTLGLAALDIKEGDEVILPDLTYFACSDVIVLLGAKPVFVDVDKNTWTIDPSKILQAITPRTKAIMPVGMYGNPVNQTQIASIADKYRLKVIEDACPTLGAKFNGLMEGELFDFTAYSFQGAKILTTGTGGMLTTNDDSLYEKAMWLNDHCEDPKRKFWQNGIGYEFMMSNLQAAFGLAQLERIEEMVAKKRQIFDWYYERLKDLKDASFNYEYKDTRSNRWMSSIVFTRIPRELVRSELKEKGIDTRPFFYPISTFPMFEEANTPVSHFLGSNGLNLPSGHNLTENDIDYICRAIKKVVKKWN